MERRKFIKNISVATPMIFAFKALSNKNMEYLTKLASHAVSKNKVLVLVQLNGGNDSLNTFIPLNEYSFLEKVRKDILIPEQKILKLNDNNPFGFHPEMEGLRRLYNDKLLTVIHGVGYPNAGLSHFKAINIKMTADCSNTPSRTGWIGRYIDKIENHHSHKKNDHISPCIRIGEVSPIISQGEFIDNGIGINKFSDIIIDEKKNSLDSDMTSFNAGKNITFIKDVESRIQTEYAIINEALLRQETLSKLYPIDTGKSSRMSISEQLKLVARLIGGNLDSRIYVVSQFGYDTHANQVEKTDSTKGLHAELLKNLSEAIHAFEDDLYLMGIQDKVLGMTFSEFGRRIKSSEYGTDHGLAESVILFGTKLKGGMIGNKFMELDDSMENLPHGIDFRSLYYSILKNWFEIDDNKIKSILPNATDVHLDLFKY